MAVWSTFVNHGPCYVGLDASTRRDLTEIAANIKQAEETGIFRSIDLLLGCTLLCMHPYCPARPIFSRIQTPLSHCNHQAAAICFYAVLGIQVSIADSFLKARVKLSANY